jgi:hypothetical protein
MDHFLPVPLSALRHKPSQYIIFTLKSINYKQNSPEENPNRPTKQNEAFFYAKIAT